MMTRAPMGMSTRRWATRAVRSISICLRLRTVWRRTPLPLSTWWLARRPTSDAGPDAESIQCEPNENLGCANISAIRLWGESGMAYVEQAAQKGSDVTQVSGPSACVPGEYTCIDDRTIGACRRDETGFVPRACDIDSPAKRPVLSACNPEGKIASNTGANTGASTSTIIRIRFRMIHRRYPMPWSSATPVTTQRS